MNLPNKITLFRLVLAPLFFLSVLVPVWRDDPSVVFLIAGWTIFLLIELSDILDGYLARRRGQVTDIGKVLDPFSDVVSRVTYFICFTRLGLMPIWMFALILYRELAQTFIRGYMSRKGVVLAANVWGKIKSILYGISGGFGLLVLSFQIAGSPATETLTTVATLIFGLVTLAALVSFSTYLKGIIRETRS